MRSDMRHEPATGFRTRDSICRYVCPMEREMDCIVPGPWWGSQPSKKLVGPVFVVSDV